jgi:hypothetical protein
LATSPEWLSAFLDRDYKSFLFPVLNPALSHAPKTIDTPRPINSTKAVQILIKFYLPPPRCPNIRQANRLFMRGMPLHNPGKFRLPWNPGSDLVYLSAWKIIHLVMRLRRVSQHGRLDLPVRNLPHRAGPVAVAAFNQRPQAGIPSEQVFPAVYRVFLTEQAVDEMVKRLGYSMYFLRIGRRMIPGSE